MGVRALLAGALLGLMVLNASNACSQAFPSKPIRLIVPFPPGGVDTTGRLLAQKMTENIGQAVVLENRGGANGMIGSSEVARAAPDGYTILMTTPSTHITAVFLSKNVPFDPVKDFTPICMAVEPVTVLVVGSAVKANSVRELVDLARRNPGKLSYSSSGIGSAFHLMGELFKTTANVDILHVPYKGTGPMLADVVAGRIDMTFVALNSAIVQEKNGKLKILAVAEGTRYARMPELSSAGETVPGFEKPPSWFGFFGPAGMARPVVDRLNGEIIKAVNAPQVRSKLDEGGFAIINSTPEQFALAMKRGFEQYGKAVQAAGVKPE
jgi:tripartite-type tricarboxylate transporter receptor subunit TctC